MAVLDDVSVNDLVAIRNAFDRNHRVSAEAMHKQYGGQKIKEVSIEFSPLDSVKQAMIVAINEAYHGATHAIELIHELCDSILDTVHNFAIELLDWVGLHLFVVRQLDDLIKSKS